MPDNPRDVIVAHCGLVCTDCGAFRRGRCQGCHSDRPMFRNCPVKACALSRNYATCAECVEFTDLKQCGKLHNFISRLFGVIFRHDRIGNLNLIRDVGLADFETRRQTTDAP